MSRNPSPATDPDLAGRGVKERLAMLVGRRDWVSDGRCLVPVPFILANFFFQRVLRLNGECRYPVHFTSTVVAPDGLVLGRGVARYLASSGGVYIQAINGVEIGDDTMIAPGVKIISANHAGTDARRWSEQRGVVIGARCWLGASAIILPGVTVGSDSIVGAGAVVTKDVPACSVATGVPATWRPRRTESFESESMCAESSTLSGASSE